MLCVHTDNHSRRSASTAAHLPEAVSVERTGGLCGSFERSHLTNCEILSGGELAAGERRRPRHGRVVSPALDRFAVQDDHLVAVGGGPVDDVVFASDLAVLREAPVDLVAV